MNLAGRSISYPSVIMGAIHSALTRISLGRPKAKPQEIWLHTETRNQMLDDLRISRNLIALRVWELPLVADERMPLDEVHVMGIGEMGQYCVLARTALRLVNFEEIAK